MFSRFNKVGKTVVARGPKTSPGRNRAFPALERLQNGDLLVAYREGTDHWQTPDGTVRLVRSKDAGKTWREPTTVVEQYPDWDCGTHQGLAQLSNGTILLPFTRFRAGKPSGRGRLTEQDIWVMKSTDDG